MLISLRLHFQQQVVDGCSKKRPDSICDYGDQLIIIEIDENQYGSYDPGCENKRIMQLSQDVAHRPLVVIRFNPDRYNLARGSKTYVFVVNLSTNTSMNAFRYKPIVIRVVLNQIGRAKTIHSNAPLKQTSKTTIFSL